MRTLFFGMDGRISAVVLDALLAAGADIAGVVLAAGRLARQRAPVPIAALPPPLIPLGGAGQPSTIAQLAWARGLPVFELRRPADPVAIAALAELRADIACVACFPLRIPPALLALPRHGVLNVHPSLLPHWRGPEPLFWVLRSGHAHAGATIHWMDQGFDTGDLLLQAPLALPDGASYAQAERMAAELGGRLLIEALARLHAGTAARRPQPPGGSYAPYPAESDWRIDAGWPARRAFNFVRGVEAWGQPFPLATGGAELLLARALGYDAGATLGAPYRLQGGEALIQLSPGVLRAHTFG